jgi:RNA polymerase sigma-70 factor (ECF subfamily)
MATAHEFSSQLQKCIPHLRAYARSLTRNPDAADDLVQDTLLRGWAAREQFETGTNFKAWMFTILRNHFLSERRRDRSDARPLDDLVHENLVSPPSQDTAIHFDDMARAFWRLGTHQREILMFVGAMGLGYEEAARIIGCPTGTIRSRLSRARTELQSLLDQKPDNRTRRRPERRGGREFLRTLGRLQARSPQQQRRPARKVRAARSA